LEIENIEMICRAFSSKNRIQLFLDLAKRRPLPPVKIAETMGISRAGLQKHLEVLLKVGFLVKIGSGRNTRYRPTEIGKPIFKTLNHLGDLAQLQREFNSLEQVLQTIDTLSPTLSNAKAAKEFKIHCDSKRAELKIQLKEKLK